MSLHLLSKSSFIKGLQCHKSLYLYKNYYHLKDTVSEERQALFNRGHEVGLLARKLFPSGADASPERVSKFSESVLKTRELIETQTKIIYEPAFLFSGVLVALDILEALPPALSEINHSISGSTSLKWNAFEVKSSAKISPAYILDAALQYWVIKNSGIEISDFFIVNLNTNYIRKGILEYAKLFSRTSVMEEIIKIQPFIEENISIQKNVVSQRNIPDIPVGTHCFEPYQCDFMGHCWQNVPGSAVFGIPSMPANEKFKLYSRGIKDIDDILQDPQLSDFQKIHLESKKNEQPHIDLSEIKKFLGSLKSPLFFVDFEVMMPAIPLFNGTRPFQHIPFQYSIYKNLSQQEENKPDGKVNDNKPGFLSFLADTGYDPRKDFIERFLKDSEGEGSIIVYDSILEKSVLNSLKKDFPQYKEKIDQRLKRIIDLMLPFKNRFIYSHKMGGNFSLKHVTNAFLPEIRFEELKISNGRLSMIAFESLQKESDLLKIIETREALEKYCKTDTEAMQKMVALMEKIVNEY